MHSIQTRCIDADKQDVVDSVEIGPLPSVLQICHTVTWYTRIHTMRPIFFILY